MNFVKEETLLGNKKIIVGDRMHDLVLENLGRIYIRYGNSYKDFNSIISSINQITKSSDRMTIEENGLQDPSTYSDNSFVYDVRGERLFLVYNGELLLLAETAQNKNNRYVLKSGDTMTGQLQIQTNDAPLFVRSSKLVKNFNSEYLNGYCDTDFAKKAKDEIIVGDWTFKGKNTFTEKNTFEETAIFTKSKGTAIRVGTGDIITDGSLGTSSFVSGMNGHGWRLDASTNTLTIDNLIVRGILQVFELQVNKISATNGALWVTDSFKIKSIHKVIPIDYSNFTISNESETEEQQGERLNNFNEFLQNINFNTDDYYIPYSLTGMPEGSINEYSSGENITSFIPPIGSLASRTEKETSEDGLPFYIHNHLFRVNKLIEFKNNFSNISLFSENTLKELFKEDVIDYKHVLQKYSKRQGELEKIGDKYIEPFDDEFDKHWYEVVIRPKLDSNKKTYYIETDENGNVKEENIANINLYYKYFGSLNKDYPNLYVLESEEGEYPVFRPGDILRCQKFTGNGVKQYHAIVCGIIGEYGVLVQLQRNCVLNQKTTYKYDKDGNLTESSVEYDTSFYDRSATAGGDVSQVGDENADIFNYGPQKDDALVRIGSIITGDRQNSMYLTSSEDNSPFEDIIVGVNRPDYTVQYFTLGEKYTKNEQLFYKVELESNTKVRMGNLTGIYNEKYGNKQPHGYGLYGENVFLTGEFYLNNGKSMMSIDDDVRIAVGNINDIEEQLSHINEDINNSVESAIVANKDSIMRMGLDYNLFALGSAGMTIVNPNATYDENGNVNPETVGDGDEYIKLLGDKVQINTYAKDKSGKYKILYTKVKPELWQYDEEGRPYTKVGIIVNGVKYFIDNTEETIRKLNNQELSEDVQITCENDPKNAYALDPHFQIYTKSGTIGTWDGETYCYDYIEFKETSIDSIKNNTKQLSQTAKVNNQSFSSYFELEIPYEFKLKDDNNIYSISSDDYFKTCGYYRYNINPTLAGLQLQIDFLPNQLPIVDVDDYVYNFDNDETTDTSGEYKITEIVSYTDTLYYYFPIISESALFENGKLSANLIEVRELNGINDKGTKTVSINTYGEGETILYWPNGSIMNAKVLNYNSSGVVEGCIEYFINEGWWWKDDHFSVIDNKTQCYSNLKKSTVEPDPENNGIIRVFNYFLKATALEWNACKVRGILTNGINDEKYQKLINAGMEDTTNNQSYTTNELISEIASRIPLQDYNTIPELLIKCQNRITQGTYIDYIIVGYSNNDEYPGYKQRLYNMIYRITGKNIEFKQKSGQNITNIDLYIDGHSASLFEMLDLMHSIYTCDTNKINITLHYRSNSSTSTDSFSHILSQFLQSGTSEHPNEMFEYLDDNCDYNYYDETGTKQTVEIQIYDLVILGMLFNLIKLCFHVINRDNRIQYNKTIFNTIDTIIENNGIVSSYHTVTEDAKVYATTSNFKYYDKKIFKTQAGFLGEYIGLQNQYYKNFQLVNDLLLDSESEDKRYLLTGIDSKYDNIVGTSNSKDSDYSNFYKNIKIGYVVLTPNQKIKPDSGGGSWYTISDCQTFKEV